MIQPLTKWEHIKAKIAVWLVVNLASRISAMAVLSLCLDIGRKYVEEIEIGDEL